MKKAWIPLIVFAILVVFLAIGLTRDPREVPSPLINKPAPAFKLAQLHTPEKVFDSQTMLGQVWLLNTWASWCVACREEHPVLMEYAKTKTIPLVGLDYKDKPEEGIKWLKRHGDPYDLSVRDIDGRVGIDFGVYGVPETFLIDKQGVIRYKHIGPVTPQALQKTIIPLIKELQK
jgi:cytochrome c biogenesis protein CcmG/thiol:disulfide interchange protein DsbE